MSETGYCYVWQFEVRSEFLDEFLKAYSPGGAWTQLFKKADGYMSTELVRDLDNPNRFLTIDRWTGKTLYLAFRKKFAKEHQKLDSACERFTISETYLGEFTSVVS